MAEMDWGSGDIESQLAALMAEQDATMTENQELLDQEAAEAEQHSQQVIAARQEYDEGMRRATEELNRIADDYPQAV